jgi:tetratricopeptide (TPR) repeat protein/predicted Ser/Thr protein kinase
LARAVDAGPEERPAVVALACGEDRELQAEVESLLAADEGADLVLRGLRSALADGLRCLGTEPPAPSRHRAGERFGPYVVEREIGRGGMGEVFLGRRADRAYEGCVAIKVLAHAAAGDELTRRFHQERQILAALDHPHVARLLDAGTTADGDPYFVMEYVEGTAIDDWCDERCLPVADRIRLFLKVLDAVQAAHRSLVVHRDLKPANVRVTPDGVPKLLDFGIAKLLDSRSLPWAAETTLTSLRPMTLSHASPEQVAGGPVITATDVYSLGVTLYRLLTGRLPYRENVPLHQAILHDDPLPASARVTADAAKDRGVAAAQLRRRLAGDLDVILQTALAKEPSRRYGSAEAFAADLERHLQGLPVSARRPTLTYRTAKFVRRNPLAATLGGVLAAAVLVFVVSMGLLADRLARERDTAEADRDRARQEELETEQVRALLVDLFSQPDPSRARGESVTAREVLDRGAERVTRDLADQPRVQAELLDTIGQAYRGLGLYDAASPLLEQSLGIRRQALGELHPETLDSLLHVAGNLHELGDFERARDLHRQALAGRLRVLGTDSPRVAEALEDLADDYRLLGGFLEAGALLRRALALRLTQAGDDVGLSRALQRLALVESAQGRYREAEVHHRAAHAIRLRALGEDHPETLAAQKGTAKALRVLGRYAEAEAIQRRLLEIERRVFGADHGRVAFTLADLGFTILYQGRAAEAEIHFREALRIRRETLGENHPAVMVSLHNLAYAFQVQGRHAEAEPLYRRAVEHGRRSFSARSPNIAHALIGLGEVLTAQGAAAEAEPLLREALELRRLTLGADNPLTAQAESSLAECLMAQGAVEEAEGLLVHAWSIQQKSPEEYRTHREQTRRRQEALKQVQRR